MAVDHVVLCTGMTKKQSGLKTYKYWRGLLHNLKISFHEQQLAKKVSLKTTGNGPIVIHSHGIWCPGNHTIIRLARKSAFKLVISPHGMLSPWALSHHSLRKRVAWNLYQQWDLLQSDVFQATSTQEASHIRRLGFKQPIAVIPNGIELQASVSRRRKSSDLKTALFIGRVHPVKGLADLVDAWSAIRPSGWQLIVAGQSDNAYGAFIKKRIRQAGLSSRILLIGEVSTAKIADLYSVADVFILPSHAENFGLVVAEALAAGVPVIATKSTPWEDLRNFRCGWWVENGVESLSKALVIATTIDETERFSMGERGRMYAQRFNSTDVAKTLHGVYRWVVGTGEQPSCVVTD